MMAGDMECVPRTCALNINCVLCCCDALRCILFPIVIILSVLGVFHFIKRVVVS